MANNYEQSEITRRATEYVAQGMSPPEALAKARAEVEAINNLPSEGLQGTLTGPAFEAYKQANPQDFMTDAQKADMVLNKMYPNNPIYNPEFQQYMRDNPRTAADEAYTTLIDEGMKMKDLQGMTDEEILRELQRLRQRRSTMDAQGPGLFNFELNAGF